MYTKLKNQLKEFYLETDINQKRYYENDSFVTIRKKIFDEMDRFYIAEKNQYLLKSHMHTLIADYFEPQIFTDSPFFFEMGLRGNFSWGMCGICPSVWMKDRGSKAVAEEHPLTEFLKDYFLPYFHEPNAGICSIMSSFDDDHHTLGYSTLFDCGINGIISRAQNVLKSETDCRKSSFCRAVIESCEALIKIARRFGEKAKSLMAVADTDEQKEFLTMISDASVRIPAEAPTTFYEGLAMILFMREVVGTLENIGISQLGHIDRLLYNLYENDIASGILTEAKAKDLLTRWMIYTDIKFDLHNNQWPETSTCIQLGGCDQNGKVVYNNVTRIVIEAHRDAGFVNPKLNCRYNADSPKEYLKLIGSALLSGHNNFVLINDDIVISGLTKSGVDIKDARLYVSGGCQETMIEGCGHTEGAGVYVSVPRILDLCLRYDPRFAEVGSVKFSEDIKTFDEFYDKFLSFASDFLRLITDQRNVRQSFNKAYQCCPLFSATQTGCIENGMDYTEGGAKYNFSTIALVGLATLTDSLYAIKTLVYDQRLKTLSELIDILANNWVGYDDIRSLCLLLPKYGHNHSEVDALADRLLGDITGFIKGIKNERGGSYIPSLFVYYYFEYFSGALRATPDGRRHGDLMSMGCGPSQLAKSTDITEPLQTMNNVDFTACGGGSAVFDVQLPLSGNMTADIFASLVYSCNKLKCPTIQPNVVCVDDLLDAKTNPQNHRDLIVRISGLSAYFVALPTKIQDEIINRAIYLV